MRDAAWLCGLMRCTPAELCQAWLGRSEGYIRVLRYNRIEPSVETLTVCAHKLGNYADNLRTSDAQSHQQWVKSFDRLKALCDQAIARQAEAVWRQPARMGA